MENSEVNCRKSVSCTLILYISDSLAYDRLIDRQGMDVGTGQEAGVVRGPLFKTNRVLDQISASSPV